MLVGVETPQCFDKLAQARAEALGDKFRAGAPDAEEAIRTEISNYNFFHEMQITPNIRSKGVWWSDIFTTEFAKVVAGIDFTGKRVIDIGARDGAMTLMAEERGATTLVAVDNDPSPGLTNFLIPFRKSKIVSLEGNLYHLRVSGEERFDIAFFPGVLYHLHTPFFGLEKVRDALKPGGLMVLETAILDEMLDFPVVFYAAGQQSPYEPTSPTFFNIASLKSALTVLGFTDLKFHPVFAPSEFDPSVHFPEFAKIWQKPMNVSRVIVEATNSYSFTDAQGYFAGTHRYHSSGGQGF